MHLLGVLTTRKTITTYWQRGVKNARLNKIYERERSFDSLTRPAICILRDLTKDIQCNKPIYVTKMIGEVVSANKLKSYKNFSKKHEPSFLVTKL